MASWCESGREGTALAIRFDRPLEGQHATALWLPCSFSIQAGTKHSLKAPPLHFGTARSLRSAPASAHRKWPQLC